VLRDGKVIGTVEVAETNAKTWVAMMVGRDLDQLFVKRSIPRGPERLKVSNLSTDKLRSISFSVHSGEILGVAGLVGSGRTELARAIFGADTASEGRIEVDGTLVAISTPNDAIAHGVALVPEDRKGQGVVLPMSIKENITLAKLSGVSRAGQLNRSEERRVAGDYVRGLRIATPSIKQQVANLSGGNQQKVVLAKWLYTEARILIADEPTRGIDIGAKAEIYGFLERLAEQGVAIIMISSELPELIGMADRLLVMHEGRIAGELARAEFSEEAIMTYATGLGH
jgi:ribose transport system ATP-binding protein